MDTCNICHHIYFQVIIKMVFILNLCCQEVLNDALLCGTLFYLKGSGLDGNTPLGVLAGHVGSRAKGKVRQSQGLLIQHFPRFQQIFCSTLKASTHWLNS